MYVQVSEAPGYIDGYAIEPLKKWLKDYDCQLKEGNTPDCSLKYSDKTLEHIYAGYLTLCKAYNFMLRIDKLFEGDYGEETFNAEVKGDIKNFHKLHSSGRVTRIPERFP